MALSAVRKSEQDTGAPEWPTEGTFGISIVLTFMTYCVEEYKAHKGLTGLQVEELFGRYGVFDYIEKYYDVLHTMGNEYIMNDIDEFIAKARSDTKKK